MTRVFLMSVVGWWGLAPRAGADDWPQWRGPNRDGVWPVAAPVKAFTGNKKLAASWRVPVGGGYAGVAVADGRVYVLDHQTAPAEMERILCLRVDEDQLIWKHEYPVAYRKLDYGNGPRATPTVHDGRVYVFGAVGHLHCLDARTGDVLWKRDTVAEFQAKVPEWGQACSPLVDGDRLIVQIGGRPDADLVAFDRHSGRELWRALSDRPGYSSPVLIRTKAGPQLVYWTPQNVVGLDPSTGKVRWKVPYASTYDVSISDPVWHQDVLLVSGYWEGSKAFRLDDRGENPQVVWQDIPDRKDHRLSCLMSTPLCHGGYVYALDRFNGLKCVDLRTGKIKWEGVPITPRGRNPQATLVWAGPPERQTAIILNELGDLKLARLTPQGYRELARASVIDGTWAHPAFAGGCLFVRNDEEVRCVRIIGD